MSENACISEKVVESQSTSRETDLHSNRWEHNRDEGKLLRFLDFVMGRWSIHSMFSNF